MFYVEIKEDNYVKFTFFSNTNIVKIIYSSLKFYSWLKQNIFLSPEHRDSNRKKFIMGQFCVAMSCDGFGGK